MNHQIPEIKSKGYCLKEIRKSLLEHRSNKKNTSGRCLWKNKQATDSKLFSVNWMEIADTVDKPCSETEFKWKIETFSALPKEVDTFYESPEFNSPGFSWCARLYPNGTNDKLSEGWVGLFLKLCSGSYVTIDCAIGILSKNGSVQFVKGLHNITLMDNAYSVRGLENFLQVDELLRQKDELYPLDTLTVYVYLRHEKPKYLWPKPSGKVGSITIEGPWKEASEQKGLTVLSDNFKKLYLEKEDCDISIKVKHKYFEAHKLVLKARSVLSVMLSQDKVKRNNVIEIQDCEPGDFEIFLMYLYTGKIEKLSDNNVLGVYSTAQKYGIEDLKAECVSYLKCCMSVRNICSIIHVAKHYDDSELLDSALDYFFANAQTIILTEEWKAFKGKEPKYASELYKKSMKRQSI